MRRRKDLWSGGGVRGRGMGYGTGRGYAEREEFIEWGYRNGF